MNRDLCLEPEVMEVFPNGDLLLDELRPVIREPIKVCILDRQVMSTGAHHVEERSDAVKGAADEQNASLSVKLRLAVPLGVVRLDDPNALIDKPFSVQSHQHKCLVQLLRDVTV